MLGCASDPDPTDTNADGSTTMVSGTDSTTAGTETGTTSVGDGDGDDWAERGDSAYGVPGTTCEELGPEPVALGDNAIVITQEFGDVWQSCGGVSTASLYSFTATADGDYEFAVQNADFNPVFSLIGYYCEPLEELGCTMPPETLTQTLVADETIHIAVDSNDVAVDGMATLTITQL